MSGVKERVQTEPGLVALYDIRPGNGAGLFFQPTCKNSGSNKLQW